MDTQQAHIEDIRLLLSGLTVTPIEDLAEDFASFEASQEADEVEEVETIDELLPSTTSALLISIRTAAIKHTSPSDLVQLAQALMLLSELER